jgi:mono/diheme cytochrome c family protein
MKIQTAFCLLIYGLFSLLFSLLLSLNTTYAQSDGESLFKVCAACHTIGEGKRVGPDLKGISENRTEDWIIKFVQNSTELIASGDADAKAIFDEYKIPMPPNNLSDDQVRTLIAYIDSKSGGDSGGEVAEVVFTADQISAGERLFSGEDSFEAGGATCNSCHNVNYDAIFSGGGLARDLTEANTRITTAGVRSIIATPPFPAMKQAYDNHKLTDTEVENLTAFLFHVDAEKENNGESNAQATLLMGGFAGFILILLLLAAMRMKVKAKSVNHEIYKRQIKSI